MIPHVPARPAGRTLSTSYRRIGHVAAVAIAALALPLALSPTSVAAHSEMPMSPTGETENVAPNATIVATATDDAYTTSTAPDRNSGSSTKVAVGKDGNADKVGYFKFDISSDGLQNPELVLTVTGGSAGQITVHSTNTSWGQSSITHATAPVTLRQVGQTRVSGGRQTIVIPLSLQGGARSQGVSLAVTRGDGGITRIGSQEAPGNIAATLRDRGADDPITSTLPIYVSPSPDQGNFIESYEARRAKGWASAFYTYWPGDIQWNASWSSFVQRHPGGIPVIGSPKGVNPANVKRFMDNLPQAWRDQWIMAYYQEPEDNFTTPAARAQFRERVGQMADLVRPYGVKNAVHLQEWTINPYNTKPWAGEEALAEFFEAEDIDYISWSLYPAEGRSMRAGIDRIKEFSETYAPGIPWGITAAGSPVQSSAPIGGQARALRADIVLDAAQYTAETGGQAFGWFDFDSYNPGRDQLVSKDPALRAVLTEASEIGLPED